MHITYATLIEALIESFPELRTADGYEAREGEAGPYIIFGDVVYPYVERLLREGDAQDAAVARVFAFLEMLAAHDDPEIPALVSDTITEGLKSDRTLLELARPFMGPSLLELAKDRIPWRYPKRLRGVKGRYPSGDWK